MSYIIRTSDRQNFKRRRRAWDFGSKIRKNLEPHVLPKPLEFGTAIHEALEVYYQPETWNWDREVVEALSLCAFLDKQLEQRRSYEELKGELDIELETDFNERNELGKGMLLNYFRWAPTQDNFIPKFVEIEFEVPIPVDMNRLGHLPENFETAQGYLFFKGEQVFYQGRIDLLLEDKTGRYWLADHKTTAQLGDISHLELDEQCGSYAWAIQEMLGIKVEGVIYNELFKAAPHPPKELKKGGYSKDKQQNTTYELYVETLTKAGISVTEYAEFLEFLKEQGNKFFRRVQVHRSQTELQNLGHQICLEAIDMLNDPFTYPNPTRYNCSGCMFRTPCLAVNDGSDVDWIIETNYKPRSE